ncbi:MAG: sulfate reduction electron transfer complex DsrMKJOP subunit DsrM [Nitrospirae bacterium]|nr:sulfate reduction electron transfer complex DsrMKJOP subunit DsrM [Nitrospirota bacterium]MCL5978739.1 sulfate reduction electron transfer complex DsrMKJOP subunit DsrM [Nitrospirota bacterium]
MKILFPFFAVIALVLLAVAGTAANLHFLFGVVIPYAALFIFIFGMIYRVLKWAKSPVPFCIPTTCGQQKSFSWIKQNKLENPSSTLHVIGRMALEVLTFRSLFRNIKGELRDSSKLVYGSDKWLWLGGIAFHYSFLIVLLRHIRLFAEPAPAYLFILEAFDGFLQIGIPRLFATGVVLLAAVAFLFLRRIYVPQVRYISLAADYFPLFLIMCIAATGIIMRYFLKTDIVGVKELTMGLVSFSPVIPKGVGAIFYVHLLLVSALFAYFPFSKLVHMGGVFLSPTRNMVANSREFRHVNPWNYPVKVHTYEEYEEDFRDKMKMAEIPVEKE